MTPLRCVRKVACLRTRAWRMSFSRGGYRVERLAGIEFVFEAVAQVSDRLSDEPLLVTYPGVGPRPRNSVDHSIFQFDRQRQQDVGGLTARADLRHPQILPALHSGSRVVAKFIDTHVRNQALSLALWPKRTVASKVEPPRRATSVSGSTSLSRLTSMNPCRWTRSKVGKRLPGNPRPKSLAEVFTTNSC